jgi:hypothetical protein
MGVLSALPIVYFGNVCCCLWVISGGVIAAYVLQQNEAMPITAGDGALVGLLAGVVGACVHFALSVPIDIIMAPFERNLAERIVDLTGNVEMRDMIERVIRRRAEGGMLFLVLGRLLLLPFFLVIGSAFSTVGGVIGQAIFQKKLPPNTIDVTPPPPSA